MANLVLDKKSQADMLQKWNLRWKARTDLLWLCHKILDFDRVNAKVHGPMLDSLQQFKMPTKDEAKAKDLIKGPNYFEYTPGDPYIELEGPRRKVLLFSRGYYKTSTNTIAHTIQWLLNYPQMAIATLFSTDDKAKRVLAPIRSAFQTNEKLRDLFPDYCPSRAKANDFGNSESFTLANRDALLKRLHLPVRVEPSVMSQSLEKSKAGYHFDLIKCSDIVDENMCELPQQRAATKNQFGLLPKLLVKRYDGKPGWIDVEGTFYHTEDLHVELCKDWIEKAPNEREWSVFVRGCFERDTGDNPPKYDPSELFYCDFKKDANGKRVPTWPETDPIEALEREEKSLTEGGRIFFAQRVLDPFADKSSERPFAEPLTWVMRDDFKSIPIDYHITTIDLADTINKRSNFSVITTCAYDRSGRCYVHNIQRGKWNPDETIERIFATHTKFTPVKIIIEDYAYVHGLRPSIERYASRTGIYPNFHYEPAGRTTDKVSRIIKALQPPLYTGLQGHADLRFVDPIDLNPDIAKHLRTVLEREFKDCTVFSTGASDDILDTLANQYLCRDWFGKEGLRGGIVPQEQAAIERVQREQYDRAWREMLGIDKIPEKQTEYQW